MGETETQREAAERARAWAEQRRAEAQARFDTPAWLGPARTTHSEAPATHLPSQPEPVHEALVKPSPGVDIPAHAHWVEQARPRVLAGSIVALAVLGGLACLVIALTSESVMAIVGLAACALLAVLFRGAMMSSGLTTSDLSGSILKVHHDGVIDTFDLSGPTQIVELVGSPGRRDWRLRVECVDGRLVELGPRQVDPEEMHRIVGYYRDLANRNAAERDRRMHL